MKISSTKRALAVFAVLSFLGAVASAAESPKKSGKVARGKYLVRALACNDCHTPWRMGKDGPEPDMTRMLSGHPQAMAMPPPRSSPRVPGRSWPASR